MTVIVGLKHRTPMGVDRVYLGADSASVGGLDLMVSQVSKLWTKDEWAFGCTTSWRMNQLLRYSLVMPRPKAGQDLMEYMCTDFINAVRACFRDGGFMLKEKDREEGGTFLVGHKGRLFRVDSDFQVGEAIAEYDAVGCGECYAKGSLYSTALVMLPEPDPAKQQASPTQLWVPMDPEVRVYQALACAEQHSAGVRGPHTVVFV